MRVKRTFRRIEKAGSSIADKDVADQMECCTFLPGFIVVMATKIILLSGDGREAKLRAKKMIRFFEVIMVSTMLCAEFASAEQPKVPVVVGVFPQEMRKFHTEADGLPSNDVRAVERPHLLREHPHHPGNRRVVG